jgi:hypothetical protein
VSRKKAKTRRWRFGVGQSAQEERRELREAQASGATDLYMRGQRHAELIAEEAERRARTSGAGTP